MGYKTLRCFLISFFNKVQSINFLLTKKNIISLRNTSRPEDHEKEKKIKLYYRLK